MNLVREKQFLDLNQFLIIALKFFVGFRLGDLPGYSRILVWFSWNAFFTFLAA